MLTESQKRDAYREAQQILRLDKTWQHIMPGERKPNFRRAAREIIKRALGQKVVKNQPALDIHGGLMHEHAPREAALVERTLKNGMFTPQAVQSFHTGAREPEGYPPPREHEDIDVDVYLHDHAAMLDYPSHVETGSGVYHSSTVHPPEHAVVPSKAPPGTTLPSDYEAVH